MPRRSLEEIRQTAGPIANYVRARRKELGYTQEQLAYRVGVGRRFLKELEQGKPSVRLDKAMEVINFLGGVMVIKDREVG